MDPPARRGLHLPAGGLRERRGADDHRTSNLAMHLLFARNGKWADFHGSMAMPTPDDVKRLAAIMASIRVEEDPAPAAATAPVAAEGIPEPLR